jgi:hypothetical protein
LTGECFWRKTQFQQELLLCWLQKKIANTDWSPPRKKIANTDWSPTRKKQMNLSEYAKAAPFFEGIKSKEKYFQTFAKYQKWKAECEVILRE